MIVRWIIEHSFARNWIFAFIAAISSCAVSGFIGVSPTGGYDISQSVSVGNDLFLHSPNLTPGDGLTTDSTHRVVSYPVPYPSSIALFSDDRRVIAGHGIAINIAAPQIYGFSAFQSPSNFGDSTSWSFLLANGTYELKMIGQTGYASGTADWYLDDVRIISGQDWYDPTGQSNVIRLYTPISVRGSGRHVLRSLVSGLNPSSSGYNIALTKASFASTD